MVIATSFFAWRLLTEAAYFRVSRVEVEGDPDNLVSDAIYGLASGQNIVIFPEDKIRAKITENLLISDISFEKKFPSAILAKVTFREPVMTWQSRHGRFLVDRLGVAYKLASSESLPQVSAIDSEVKLGDKLSDQEVGLSLRILEVTAGKFNVLTINFKGRDVRIQLSSGSEVIVDSSGDLVQMRETLQLILAQAKIEGRIPRQIDLRYSKPIVNY